MNFQQLKFVREAVRQDLNLTAAANALYTSQSGVSKQIRELEIELGIEIFIRKGKRLTGLTQAGEGAVNVINRILLETENLRRFADDFSDDNRGRLVIATTHNQARYTLPDVIRRFSEEFPDVQLELRQGTPRFVADCVASGEADIAIATEMLDEYAELIAFPAYTWRHIAVIPVDHPLAASSNVSLADIAQYSIITYNPEFAGRTRIDAAFTEAGLKPDIRLTAMDADVIKTYVSLGLGIGIVAEQALTGDSCERLVEVANSKTLFKANTTKLAIRRRVLLRSYAYRLIEMVAPHLKEADLIKVAEPAEINVDAKLQKLLNAPLVEIARA